MNNLFTHEQELRGPIDECAVDGRLNPQAKGFSRFPYHNCNLNGPWGRQKRWDYWCVTNNECAFSITYADIDYLGLVAVSLLDFNTKQFTEAVRVVPLARGLSQPDTVAGGDIRFKSPYLNCSIIEGAEETVIQADFKKLLGKSLQAEIFITRPKDHETLNVLIPWSERQFQFTSKQNTLPARGVVQVGTNCYQFDTSNDSYATLDYGRGIWPTKTKWNWASASGKTQGSVVGLQFGGKWTQGTGFTENGIMLDGKLFKIGEEVEWRYNTKSFMDQWAIRSLESDVIDLTFEPFYQRSLNMPTWMPGASVNQCFGKFSGMVRLGEGKNVEVSNLIGWAEEMQAKW